MCVSVSSGHGRVNPLDLCPEAVLATIQDVFGTSVPVLPNINSSADELDQIRQWLGGEYSTIVVDGSNQWPDNALGAAAGVVKTPGLLILLLPGGLKLDPDSSPYETHLKQRLKRYLVPHPTLAYLWQTPAPENEAVSAAMPKIGAAQAWEQEQRKVLKSLIQRCQSQSETLDVLTARRGRGKSALLGHLITHLVPTRQRPTDQIPASQVAANQASTHQPPHDQAPPNQSQSSIILTATHPNQVVNVLKHANGSGLRYTPLDKALQSQATWLLVDEAGSIPLPVLHKLAKRSQHVVLAGTVDGYEGSGRALTLRLSSHPTDTPLGRRTTHLHTLTHPVRWPNDDPVEAMINDVLRLNSSALFAAPGRQDNFTQTENAQIAANAHSPKNYQALKHQRISSQQLLDDETLLDAVFGLLLQAHYQTSSRDLKHLLNQDGLILFTQTYDEELTAACLIACEGGMSDSTRRGVHEGKRRPRHQKLPMLLYRQCEEDKLLSACCWRVVRIAVRPNRQQCGLGTQLLNHIFMTAASNNTPTAPQYIGASFGANPAALSFWQRSGFHAFQLGFKLNPRSGQRSVSVAKPVKLTGVYSQSIRQAQATLIDTLHALQQLSNLEPTWLATLYEADFLEHVLFDRLTQPPKTDSNLETAVAFTHNEMDDLQRLQRWREGKLHLHEVWGPLLRVAGGAQEVASWDFSSDDSGHIAPGSQGNANAKQITKQVKDRLFRAQF